MREATELEGKTVVAQKIGQSNMQTSQSENSGAM
jgi:hypothetical protein